MIVVYTTIFIISDVVSVYVGGRGDPGYPPKCYEYLTYSPARISYTWPASSIVELSHIYWVTCFVFFTINIHPPSKLRTLDEYNCRRNYLHTYSAAVYSS